MATYNQVRITLHQMKPALKTKFGVTRLGFFDCFIDHYHHRECELNILVELDEPLGWKFFELKNWIEYKVGFPIDICTPRALKPALREEILAKTIFV